MSANASAVAATKTIPRAIVSLVRRRTWPRVVYVISNGTTTRMPRPSPSTQSRQDESHGAPYPSIVPVLPMAPPIIGANTTAPARNTSIRRPGVNRNDDLQRSNTHAPIAGSAQLPTYHHAAGSIGTPKKTSRHDSWRDQSRDDPPPSSDRKEDHRDQRNSSGWPETRCCLGHIAPPDDGEAQHHTHEADNERYAAAQVPLRAARPTSHDPRTTSTATPTQRGPAARDGIAGYHRHRLRRWR